MNPTADGWRIQAPLQQPILASHPFEPRYSDARMLDPIWLDGRLVGSVTSGAYDHHVKQSLALAYVLGHGQPR